MNSSVSTAPNSPRASGPESVAVKTSKAEADERIAEQQKMLSDQIAVIEGARQNCGARIQVMGEAMAGGDAIRAIGLARNARAICDEGFSAISRLNPPKAAAPAWADMLSDCQTALRLGSDIGNVAEQAIENPSSPTAVYEVKEAAEAAGRANAQCLAQSAALVSAKAAAPDTK